MAGKKVILVSWNPLVVISDETDNEQCNLCRNLINEKCIMCSNITPYTIAGKCVIEANANCPHVYHKHCIDNWLKSNKNCPIDLEPWARKTSE